PALGQTTAFHALNPHEAMAWKSQTTMIGTAAAHPRPASHGTRSTVAGLSTVDASSTSPETDQRFCRPVAGRFPQAASSTDRRRDLPRLDRQRQGLAGSSVKWPPSRATVDVEVNSAAANWTNPRREQRALERRRHHSSPRPYDLPVKPSEA